MTAIASEAPAAVRAGSPRDVLYVDGSAGFGGSIVGLVRLLGALDRRRFTPHVVVSHAAQLEHIRRRLGDDVDAVVIERPGPREGAFSRLGLAWRTWRYVAALRRFCHGREIALVHANNAVSINMGAIFLARRLGVPCVVKQRGFEWSSALNRRLVRGVARFLPDSQAVADRLESVGAPPERMLVTYCAIDPAAYRSAEEPGAVREHLGLPAGPLVGVVGCLADWKGQDVFLEAVASLVEERPDLHAVVVGDTPSGEPTEYSRRLRRLASDLGLDGHVTFTGHRDDVPRVLAALDVFVHASTRPEPFGTVIAEAMASGLPVIAADAGGPPEFVVDGETGLLTEPGDAAELAAAVRGLLADPSLAASLAERGRRAVAERFSLAGHVATTQRVYEELLGPRVRG